MAWKTSVFPPLSSLLFLKILNFVEGSWIFFNFFTSSISFFLLWDCNIYLDFSSFYVLYYHRVSLFSSILRWICNEKKKKRKERIARANDQKFLLKLSIFQYPGAYFIDCTSVENWTSIRNRYINTPTLICETSSMAKIAVINVNSQQNKFLVCIIVMQYNWTHFKHKTEKMGYEIKEVCTQFRSKSPVLINIQIRLNAQNIIQDQHLRFYA